MYIGAGSVIWGNCRIGSHVRVMPNSMITADVPPGSVVSGYDCVKEGSGSNKRVSLIQYRIDRQKMMAAEGAGLYTDRSALDFAFFEHSNTGWNERAGRVLEHLIEGCESLMDLGCGEFQYAKNHLPPGCRYIPVDYKKRSEDTIICDFNKGEFPEERADTCLMILVLEYVKCLPEFLAKVAETAQRQILIFCQPIDMAEAEGIIYTGLKFSSFFTESFLIGI